MKMQFPDQKKDITKSSSDGIHQQVIHIKHANPENQLYRLNKQTQKKRSRKHRKKSCLFLAHDREKDSHRCKDKEISYQVRQKILPGKILSVVDIAFDFGKQSQVIPKVLKTCCSSVMITKKNKINQNADIYDKNKDTSPAELLSCIFFQFLIPLYFYMLVFRLRQ